MYCATRRRLAGGGFPAAAEDEEDEDITARFRNLNLTRGLWAIIEPARKITNFPVTQPASI